MMLTHILPKLQGVRKGSNGYMAKCPAHDDNVQSLSLSEANGRVLLNCFAGCTADRIVNRLGLDWRDLFDKRITHPPRYTLGQQVGPPHVTRKGSTVFIDKPASHIQQVYQYVDEEGKLLFENVRFYPKEFRQRHFNQSGNPVWNLEGVRRVPYRLPQLLACVRQGSDVFLCEGEKDCDAVRELGLTASNFKNWSEDFNRYITGANVVLLADHDLPGYRHAENAAKMISKAAASVKVLDVFYDREMPDKQGPDISDFIHEQVQNEGTSNEDIAGLICGMVEYIPEWRDRRAEADNNLFTAKSNNEWIAESEQTPASKMLFDEFWFEDEVCILFADTNVGKSILAVQIADAISRGACIGKASHADEAAGTSNLPTDQPTNDPQATSETSHHRSGASSASELILRVETPPQKVIYFDFELTKKQFETRFAERDGDRLVNHYKFHPNCLRAEINPNVTDFTGFATFEAFLCHSLEKTIKKVGAKVVIVDNLTYLADETENARSAAPLMKYLKEVKVRYGLSMLVLAHTPKRDSSKPLRKNDLMGSKMLMNFCDSSFAIGESHKRPGLRYVKQIKGRIIQMSYDSENVLLATVRKENSFLGFHFIGTGNEYDHLKPRTEKESSDLNEKIRKLHHDGYSQRQIGDALGVSAATICRHLKAMKNDVSPVSDV